MGVAVEIKPGLAESQYVERIGDDLVVTVKSHLTDSVAILASIPLESLRITGVRFEPLAGTEGPAVKSDAQYRKLTPEDVVEELARLGHHAQAADPGVPRPYRCYTCNETVTVGEWSVVKWLMAAFSPEEVEQVVDALNLVHCQGSPEQFDDEGTTVTCAACLRQADTLPAEVRSLHPLDRYNALYDNVLFNKAVTESTDERRGALIDAALYLCGMKSERNAASAVLHGAPTEAEVAFLVRFLGGTTSGAETACDGCPEDPGFRQDAGSNQIPG